MLIVCEYCGKSVETSIDHSQGVGVVHLCQCEGAYKAHEQAERLAFQRKTEAQRAARTPRRVVKPRKVRRHRHD